MVNKLRSALLPCALAAGLSLGMAPSQSHAGLQDQMDEMFNSMSNVTDPTAVMGQRRGVLAGGRYSMRTSAMDVQVLSILPPSVNSGCNGIDMFGGSFSFISADQFIQLLRTIASNASGYAFKMALQAMCPSCDAVMSKLQGLIQKMNSLSVNSCQAAKELVAGAAAMTPDGIRTAANNAAAPIATSIGAAVDSVSSMFPSVGGGGTSLYKVSQTGAGREQLENEEVLGNVVWSSLRDSNAAAWWSSGDESLMEAVMSVTGSVIVRPPEEQGGDPAITVLPPILDIRDFMNGRDSDADVRLYECGSDQCYNPDDAPGTHSDPGIQTVSIESFTAQVSEMVLSLVSKFASPSATLTSQEKAFMSSAPGAVGGMIRNLSRMSPGLAQLYANQAGPTIAQIMASDLVLDMVDTARTAMASSTSPSASQMRDQLNDVASAMRDQARNIQGNLASLQGMVETYNGLRQATIKRRLGINELSRGVGLKVR